ncbi:DedA family protein [Catenulispora rubra]|uniref:DedA family protein n=1 Tax=Catenulispora rubra TaxID=280293 RepID=UPI002B26B9E4|nr:DedA family protein [Catenulispora rubra]
MTPSLAHILAFNPISATDWINALGGFAVLGVCAIIFAETGLMIGFVLPGDSLLFIAGLKTLAGKQSAGVTSTVHLSLPLLLVAVPICAVAGAQLGHYLGARFGRPLFDKPDSRLFKRKHVDKAEEVFHRYGETKAVMLARFIPVVRTFMNPVAGVLEMPAKKFFMANLIGGIIWADGVLLLGRLASNAISADKVDKYIIPITFVIVLLSLLPIVFEWRKTKKAKAAGTSGYAAPDQDSVASSGRHRSR